MWSLVITQTRDISIVFIGNMGHGYWHKTLWLLSQTQTWPSVAVWIGISPWPEMAGQSTHSTLLTPPHLCVSDSTSFIMFKLFCFSLSFICPTHSLHCSSSCFLVYIRMANIWVFPICHACVTWCHRGLWSSSPGLWCVEWLWVGIRIPSSASASVCAALGSLSVL